MPQGDNHTALVAATKQQLLTAGVDLSGPCGAFEIIKRVAWELRAEDAGLLSKPAGNNCEGYSVDYVVYRNGAGYDVLGDAGGANIPQWNGPDNDSSFPSRWRPPFDPGDMPAPEPPPPDDELEARVLELELAYTRLEERVAALEDSRAFKTRVEAINERLEAVDAASVKEPLPDYLGRAPLFGGAVLSKPVRTAQP